MVVTSDAAPINTTNSEIKGSLNAQEIIDKPTLNQGSFDTGRHVYRLQENPTNGQNNPTASSGSSINFNGTGTRGATFQINGVNNDDSSENQNRQGASLSTIKEFQVITNNFSAEFGRGYGSGAGPDQVRHQQSSRRRLLVSQRQRFERHQQCFLAGREERRHASQSIWVYVGLPAVQRSLFSFISLDHTEFGSERLQPRRFHSRRTQSSNWFKLVPANDSPANRAFIQDTIDRFANAVPNDPAAGAQVFRGQQGLIFRREITRAGSIGMRARKTTSPLAGNTRGKVPGRRHHHRRTRRSESQTAELRNDVDPPLLSGVRR